MDLQKNIRDRCHVNTNDDGDSFVGVKADTDDAIIYFPIGYQLPANDDDLRVDINNLLGVLAAFMKEDRVIEVSKFEAPRTVDFPMHAYLKVIRSFLRMGRYYIETDPQFRTDTKGKTSWPRTVREQRALVQKNGSLVFTNMTVRSVTPNANKQITQIHRFCVYEAFEKMGWLYVPFMPDKPGPHPGIKESIYILDKKLVATNDDVEQELFNAMRDMLVYIDERSSDKQYFFGTDFFENVWERMIDKAFGVEDKEQYFPRTRWLLDYGRDKEKRPLQPDTIMIYGDRCYVLDAKLYRYGWDPKPEHLPNSADINKQITYGEYIEQTRCLPNEKLYNAFIMPYNKENNLFMLNSNFGNIGEAVSDWKPNVKNYERIQGIVVDTRYLMYNYIGTSDQQKKEMAGCIEKVLTRGPVPASSI
ncbi:LlaJI family restriction endonuclease [Mobilitalea sibirica]|uniref:LlaJI family restriction endonuclease n=1 Tax=Mobilitalea sibirica TaxID=1462919 RepID=A0A8J7GXF4_9FIRM|nr:LlaJI family restriction endonuclease [Mobilitalea sibirica]MBH1939849.1 LlaJI family restriction endonuclease [Mobilitalea sibirica]